MSKISSQKKNCNQKRVDEEGTIYYFNETTGESRWDPPDEDIVSLQPEEFKKLVKEREKSDRNTNNVYRN